MMDAGKKISSKIKDNNALDKDDDLSQKGKTSHKIETDWPTKEAVNPTIKKRKIKKIETSRLP